LKVFTKASAIPLFSGLSTGVKQGGKLQGRGKLEGAIDGEDRSIVCVSYCTFCGARMSLKRFSTHGTIMSLIISPEIPVVVAT
jgi:hypothetical protein